MFRHESYVNIEEKYKTVQYTIQRIITTMFPSANKKRLYTDWKINTLYDWALEPIIKNCLFTFLLRGTFAHWKIITIYMLGRYSKLFLAILSKHSGKNMNVSVSSFVSQEIFAISIYLIIYIFTWHSISNTQTQSRCICLLEFFICYCFRYLFQWH